VTGNSLKSENVEGFSMWWGNAINMCWQRPQRRGNYCIETVIAGKATTRCILYASLPKR